MIHILYVLYIRLGGNLMSKTLFFRIALNNTHCLNQDQ